MENFGKIKKSKYFKITIVVTLIIITGLVIYGLTGDVSNFNPRSFLEGISIGVCLPCILIYTILLVKAIKTYKKSENGTSLLKNPLFIKNFGMLTLFSGLFLVNISSSILLSIIGAVLIGMSIPFNISYLKKYREKAL